MLLPLSMSLSVFSSFFKFLYFKCLKVNSRIEGHEHAKFSHKSSLRAILFPEGLTVDMKSRSNPIYHGEKVRWESPAIFSTEWFIFKMSYVSLANEKKISLCLLQILHEAELISTAIEIAILALVGVKEGNSCRVFPAPLYGSNRSRIPEGIPSF